MTVRNLDLSILFCPCVVVAAAAAAALIAWGEGKAASGLWIWTDGLRL